VFWLVPFLRFGICGVINLGALIPVFWLDSIRILYLFEGQEVPIFLKEPDPTWLLSIFTS
jgi:hypothetical protein